MNLSNGATGSAVARRSLTQLSGDELQEYYKRYVALRNVNTRLEGIKRHSYDVKFSYHLMRLLDEAQQILETGTLNIQKNQDQLKSVRHGDWTMEEVEDYFKRKEAQLEQVYIDSTLQHSPDQEKIKGLLLECLETAYGSIDALIKVDQSKSVEKLRQIQRILDE